LVDTKVNSMSVADKKNFQLEWVQKRDTFVMSLTGDSNEVPPFVLLDLIALAWNGEDLGDSSDEDESDEDEGGSSIGCDRRSN